MSEFWSLTLREIGLVLEGHAEARQHDIELSYYNAWHSGLFSQQYQSGRFPDYGRFSPSRKKKTTGIRMTPEQMKAQAMAICAAFGGTIKKRGE